MLRRFELLIPMLALLWGLTSSLTGQVMADENGDNAEATDAEATDTEGEAGDGEAEVDDASGDDGSGEDEEAEAAAVEESETEGNVAWMLVSIAFVLMMTCPGLALFYGGLVRKKNILSVMMQCVFLMGLMSCVWAIVGYSLAFGGTSPYVGNLDHVMLNGISPQLTAAEGAELDELKKTASVAALNKSQIFAAFQGMFFIITPALICGAFAERMKFSAMAAFCVLWGLFVYCPIAHWVWADAGWLCEWNEAAMFKAVDFAGGLVVHISSGVSALVIAILIGKRKGFPTEPMPPHNLTYTCIGTGLLWVGWFGFNGGSELAADGRAVNAVFATHLAASAGVIGWSLAECIKHGKASILGACSGAVAGLVCITPASGSVSPFSGLIMGLIAGVFCFFCCTKLKNSFGYDDSLDAFGVHGMGGTLGALLTGVFATPLVSDARGGLAGNWGQMGPQIVSIVAAVGFSVVGTLIIAKILDAVMGLRVSEDEEVQGLDISQHGEEGYIFQ